MAPSIVPISLTIDDITQTFEHKDHALLLGYGLSYIEGITLGGHMLVRQKEKDEAMGLANFKKLR